MKRTEEEDAIALMDGGAHLEERLERFACRPRCPDCGKPLLAKGDFWQCPKGDPAFTERRYISTEEVEKALTDVESESGEWREGVYSVMENLRLLLGMRPRSGN